MEEQRRLEAAVEEFVIEHVSRTLAKIFAWAGLILSVLMLTLYLTAPDVTYNMDVRFIGLCILIVVISPLSLYSLAANKPFLETSEEGLMAGELVRWYCPWSNVQDIAVIDIERRVHGGLLVFAPKVTFKELVIKIHSTKEVYYDNWLHKMLGYLIIRNGRIILSAETRTSKSKDQVCRILHDRWQQAINEA